jgi:hypothetical protein
MVPLAVMTAWMVVLLCVCPEPVVADDLDSSVVEAKDAIVRKTTVFRESPVSERVCRSLMGREEDCRDLPPVIVLKTAYFEKQPFAAEGANAGAFVKRQTERTPAGRLANRFLEGAYGPLPVILVPESIVADPAWKDVVIAHEMGHFLFTFRSPAIRKPYRPERTRVMSNAFVNAQMEAEFRDRTALSEAVTGRVALLAALKPYIATFGVAREEFAVTAEIVAYQVTRENDGFNDFLCFRFGNSRTRKALLRVPGIHLEGCWDGTPKVISEYFRILWDRGRGGRR